MKKLLLLSMSFIGLSLCSLSDVNAQGVGINSSGNNPDPSAILDLNSAQAINKGLLIPRLTTSQRNSISLPAEGLMIFNTTTKCFEAYVGSTWGTMSCPCVNPSAPTAGTQTAQPTQIAWNWNTVSGATGYKFNTVNDYSSATNNGTSTSYTQTGLTYNTVYTLYVWAYNTCANSTSTALVQTTLPFSCGSTLADSRDGQNYSTVSIGTQCWMRQNLSCGTYGAVATGGQAGAGIQKYCTNISGANDPSCSMGGLYEWTEMMNGSAGCNGTGTGQPGCTSPVQGICPSGWHLPSHYEWTLLEKNVGSSPGSFTYDMTTTGWLGVNEADNLKETGTSHWDAGNTGTNSSGFTAFGSGFTYLNTFNYFGSYGFYWTATDYDSSHAWYRYLSSGGGSVNRSSDGYKGYGYSVRCVLN